MTAGSDKRLKKECYRNWLGCVNGIQEFGSRLTPFLERETRNFHRMLSEQFASDECSANCQIKGNPEVPLCEVCKKWKEMLLDNHQARGSRINWGNCNPQRWPADPWEVAKVYMPHGHKEHVKCDDFDIAALLTLMSNCKHFHQFVTAANVQQVLQVRNQVMHCPGFTMSRTERDQHLDKILHLGEALKAHVPEMNGLSEEIDKIIREKSPEEMRKMELSVMSDLIDFIKASFSQSSQGMSEEKDKEAAQRMWAFIQDHSDLQKELRVQRRNIPELVQHEKPKNTLAGNSLSAERGCQACNNCCQCMVS